MHELNSPEQHGIGKSPLISTIPTGSKRIEKDKAQNRTDQTKEGKAISKSLSSNPILQTQQSLKENIDSNKSKNLPSPLNKDKQQSLSESSKTISAELNHLNKFGNRHIHSFTKRFDPFPLDNQFQPSIDSSLIQPSFPNQDKQLTLMPNVPQCNANTSSDDDDYDEFYSVPPTQQTTSKREKTHKLNSNANINASTYRTKRSFLMDKSPRKRFHLKDKTRNK
jgi:hypothetical protein